MTPEEWQRVRPILESALELEPSSRASFLDGACHDPTLRREIESLIACHEDAGAGLLDSPPPVPQLLLDEELRFRLDAGKRIGPYEIVGEIAQGGMGAVYRAVRADGQYSQQVALKIVRVDLGSEFAASRFRNERQILASLDHPNVAKILDGGATADGVPYFVMELIDGLPITEYCDQHKLTIEARLKLFRLVCGAVHYAHQHLVIHRDIKPTNILVTAEGVPKLLDFGIAKILDPNLLPENLTVTSGFSLMTPEYASPEQLRGEAITTATDVYSLGLVLYELLAGHRPYRFTSHMPHDIARAVLESEPEKPSTATGRKEQSATRPNETPPPTPELLSGLRGDSPERLQRRLSGDLDNIVLKAIRKEPAGRYSSADQLSDDIRRHLEGLPVLARKSSLSYRCRKYVQRHKVGVAAAALVFLSLLGGLALTLYEARIARANELRAERRFNDVRALANSLIFEVHDSIKDLAGATPARKVLVSKAIQYLDSLSQEAGGDVSLQRELAAAYERVGHVQGNPYDANLGDTQGALASYRKALAIREALAAASPNSPDAQRNLADDYGWVGLALQTLGDYSGALESNRKSLGIQQKLAAASPNPKSQEALAGAYFLMAQSYASLRDLKSALESYQKSAAIREAIPNPPPFVQTRLAGTYGFMAPILWHFGERDAAIEAQRNALEIMKRLSEAAPTNGTYREFLNEAYYWTGYYQEKGGDYTQAMVNYRRALDDFQRVAALDPKDVRSRQYVELCQKSVGNVLISQGHFASGLESIHKSLSVPGEGPFRGDDDAARTYGLIGLAHSRLAAQPGVSRSASLADWKQAREAYQTSFDAWLRVKGRGELTSANDGEPDRIKRELDKCDATIQRAGKSGN